MNIEILETAWEAKRRGDVITFQAIINTTARMVEQSRIAFRTGDGACQVRGVYETP